MAIQKIVKVLFFVGFCASATIAAQTRDDSSLRPGPSPASEFYVGPRTVFDLKPFRDGNKFVFVAIDDRPPIIPDLLTKCPNLGEKCVWLTLDQIARAEQALAEYNDRKDRRGLKPIFEVQLAGDVPIWGQNGVRRAARAAERNAGTQWAPQVYATMMLRLRMLHGQSKPVPPPSFMPKGTLQLLVFHAVAPGESHASTTAIDLTFGHHSNGQTGCPFLDQALDGAGDCVPLSSDVIPVAEINSKSGNFSTHYLRARVQRRRRGNNWQATWGVGVEWHPSTLTGRGGTLRQALAERYGRTRTWFTGDVGLGPVYFRGWAGGISHGSALRNRLVGGLEVFVYLKNDPDVAFYLGKRTGQDIYNINFESDVGLPLAFGLTFGWGAAFSRSLPGPF